MLILTRKTGQGFLVGDNIEITITEISGDKVRVGINAPKDVKILRSELSETVVQNQQAAARASGATLRALASGLKKEGLKPPKAAEAGNLEKSAAVDAEGEKGSKKNQG